MTLPRALVLAAGLLLAGCSTLAPDHRQEAETVLTSVPEKWSAGPGERSALVASGDLLDLLQDDRARRIVEDVLRRNPDLQATARRLHASRLLLDVAAASRWPEVRFDAGVSRSKHGVDLTGEPVEQESRRADLALSWELDLWGRLAREHEAARRDHRARALDHAAARDSLASRAIQVWVSVSGRAAVLRIEGERRSALARVEAIVQERYRRGLTPHADLHAARARVHLAESGEAEARAELSRVKRQMETLMGEYPSGDLTATGGLPRIPASRAPSPAAVMLRRPDVRAALERLASADAEAGAAARALLPQLVLSVDLLRRWMDGEGSSLWSLGLSQPIFDRGRLLALAKARREVAEASLLELRAIALAALRQCEDALDGEARLGEQQVALERAVAEAAESSREYRRRYETGLLDIQPVLLATEQELSARRSLIEVGEARLLNRVHLALAMGGRVKGEDR